MSDMATSLSATQQITTPKVKHNMQTYRNDSDYSEAPGKSEGGVLILNEADKEKIRLSMRQNPHILQKFHSFLAYQIEFVHDFALAPGTNVSRSLGFESFVGLFGV